jgi:DNA-binding MarR family transcriptional regulator
MTPLADPGVETAARLRTVIGRLHRRLRPTQAGAGWSPTQVAVLATVIRHGPLRLSELATIEGLNPTMVSRVAAKLVAAHLVRRLPDHQDGRASRLEATAEGRHLQERMRTERASAIAAQIDRLSPERRQSLLEALPALEELAEHLKDRGPWPAG